MSEPASPEAVAAAEQLIEMQSHGYDSVKDLAEVIDRHFQKRLKRQHEDYDVVGRFIRGMLGQLGGDPDKYPRHLHAWSDLAVRIHNLRREIATLRWYGNKDCTAQADEAMARGEFIDD